MDIFCGIPGTKLLSSGRGSLLVLSDTGHVEGVPVHHGASAGPGLAPWCVLWEKSRNLEGDRGITFRPTTTAIETIRPKLRTSNFFFIFSPL